MTEPNLSDGRFASSVAEIITDGLKRGGLEVDATSGACAAMTCSGW